MHDLEGIEGVGKTTLIRKIYEHLEQQGQQVVLTFVSYAVVVSCMCLI